MSEMDALREMNYTWYDIVMVLGALGSVICAIIAFFNQRWARSSAAMAAEARDELLAVRQAHDIGVESQKLRTQVHALERYVSPGNKYNAVGLRLVDDLSAVFNLVNHIRSNSVLYDLCEVEIDAAYELLMESDITEKPDDEKLSALKALSTSLSVAAKNLDKEARKNG